MSAPKHGSPDGHEICNSVISIADELELLDQLLLCRGEAYFLEIVCDKSLDS